MLLISKLVKQFILSALVACFLITSTGVELLQAEDIICPSSENKPSLQSARAAFRAADLYCAEVEINELLTLPNINRQLKADAHLLLASVYFIEEPDANRRRLIVKRELVAMYMAERHWQGQLEIVSSEFRAILNDAHEMSEWRFNNSPDLIKQYTNDSLITAKELATTAEEISLDNQKPWYRKWWAVGSGIGLVAVAVQLIGSDQTNDPPPIPVDTLPDFPTTP